MPQSSFIAARQCRAAVVLALVAAIASGTGQAQEIIHATGPLPSFEVATVKLSQPQPGTQPVSIIQGAATGSMGAAAGSAATAPNGEKIVRQTTVTYSLDDGPAPDHVRMRWNAKILIEIAYGLPIGSESRIISGPAWIDSNADRYVVNAKIDAAEFAAMQKMAPHDRDLRQALMEQALLADRFHLKVHFETRDMPVFTLAVAKGGPRMAPAKPGEVTQLTGTGDGQNNILTAQAMTMAQLVRSPLLRPEGRMVLDRTGLTAAYDFTLKSAIGMDESADVSSLYTAIKEQLGLKLVATKAPIEVIVIDQIDRPDAN